MYEDDVRAIIGSLDGRNAHLAEQVVAKSHLAYLETRATDPTLSQAYVPWFMRIVPSDDQQARAILQLISKRETGNTAILSSVEYDTRYAVKSLTGYAAREGNPDPLILMVNPEETNISALINQLVEANTKQLIIPFYSEESHALVTGLRELRPEMQIYGTLAFLFGLEQQGGDLNELEGMVLIHSYEGARDPAPDRHMEISAGYTKDGINLVVEAILHAGLDRESIRDYIADQDHSPGTTGPIQFDDLGNRTGEIRFIQMVKGEIVPLR